MCKLKEWTASEIEEYDDARLELAEGGEIDCTRVYIKQDVDKVIADLEESHKMEVEQLLIEIAELKNDYKEACDRLQTANLIKDEQLAATRHQKYKRCLAMVKWCEERYHYLTCLENWQLTDKEYQQVIGDYWDRWYKCWLELAEKFRDKEA